jgi:hypothetical protein
MSTSSQTGNEFLLFLAIGIAAASAWFAQRWIEYSKQKQIVDADRSLVISRPIPTGIVRDIQDFNPSEFVGEELSPLAYIGYRVGITRGLAPLERQERLEYCFRMEMPKILPAKYTKWGRPCTWRRYERILAHLKMLADQRRSQNSYRHAVAHWDSDREWFSVEFGPIAERLRRYGFAE